MRTLIFPTDTGQGHNRASQALKEYLDTQGVDTWIEDVLNTGKQKSGFVSKLYDQAVQRVPKFFGMLYAFAEHISTSKHHSPIYLLNSLYANSLYQRINEWQPDVIVCPHMFSAHAVTRIIEKHGLKIPTVGIITDYCWSPFWEETCLDRYVTANQAVVEDCVARGMDREKLVPLGIPVSSRFVIKQTKAEARAKLGITKDKVFVVMGGSMGFGKIPELAAELAARMPEAQVAAVCGKNCDAFAKAQAQENVMAFPYIDNVDILMDAADVLLTKPGGLSTTEAMVKRVPLVITMPIPGGEVRNADQIVKMGMGISVNTVQDAADAACSLMMNQEAQRVMLAAQAKHCSATAAKDIGDLVLELVKTQGGERSCGRVS